MGSNFVYLPEHRQGAGGMDLVGKSDATIGGGKPGIRLVLLGIDTGSPAAWSIFLSVIRRDDEDGEK